MIINTERYLTNLKKRCDAIKELQNRSDGVSETTIRKRVGCSLFSEAIVEIDDTYGKVNECRMSKGLKPLQNVLDRDRI